MRGLPKSYFWMMVAAGLTIGAVSGLSNTSVSNTLLELIVGFATGSAGIYFLNRDTLRKEADALSIIGVVGIAFFLSFWVAYLPSTLHRYSGDAYYPWDDKLSFADNLALAELYGHTRALGISDDALKKATKADADKRGSAGNCRLLTEKPGEASELIVEVANAYHAATATNAAATRAAGYLAQRFKDVDGDFKATEPQRKAKAQPSFDAGIATLLAVIRDQPDLATPSAKLCAAPVDAAACAAAKRLEEELRGCSGEGAFGEQLIAARAHAKAYADVWKQAVSTNPGKAVITLETNP